ncbi:putative ribosome-binding factor A, mitochondrial [Anoplolepis gracilipes]|uniref:putative ribosome-binding factor A, mitochondrial n=1 Tax=Anoplolepis gracilipes TaxID=354296 RepID=UPI003BA376F4
MRNTRSFITYFQVFRCISSSSAYSSLHREGKFIKKLLHGTHKSKRKWHDPKTDLDNTLGFEQTNKVSVQTTRRMVIRDKLFMKHITDLMSMGEISDIISGSIEITHVKITSDYKLVNVFWIHSTDDVSSFISEETLQKCAKIIRHELSQLRVIGIVPPIQFVEDKQFAIGKEVERRLAMINFEDDKSEYSEQIQLDASHTDIIDQVSHAKPDTNYDSEIDKSYIELPMMRYDVLGLDHNKIMSRIIASVSKSKEAALRRQMLDINTNVDENSSNQISKENDFLTQKEQENIFSDFLITRRREERRLHRTKKLLKHELLNNFEEEIESNCNEPEDNCNHDYDEFENDYRDENSDKFNS